MTGAKAPAEAASALCNAMLGLLESSRPAALRQSALAALGTAASAFGRQHPTPFLGALPAALAAAQVRDALSLAAFYQARLPTVLTWLLVSRCIASECVYLSNRLQGPHLCGPSSILLPRSS